MNSNVFFSALNLLIAVFFLLLGTIALVLPWDIDFRLTLFDFLSSHTFTMLLMAAAFYAIAILIFKTVFGHRRRYYSVRTGAQSIAVDPLVIKQTLQPYWKGLFGSKEVTSQVDIKHNKIYITAHLPNCPFDQQRDLFKKIETDIVERLKKTLDYRDELHLTVSFEKN